MGLKFDRKVTDLVKGGKLFHTVGAEYLKDLKLCNILEKAEVQAD